ncbi:hypothetical protein ACQPZJ_12665 [Actinoplanes sp. CA-054009]
MLTTAALAEAQLVNARILGGGGPANMEAYADGVSDFAAAVSADETSTGATVKSEQTHTESDGKAYPTELYYLALAPKYVVDADSVDGIAGSGEVVGGDTAGCSGPWALPESWWRVRCCRCVRRRRGRCRSRSCVRPRSGWVVCRSQWVETAWAATQGRRSPRRFHGWS